MSRARKSPRRPAKTTRLSWTPALAEVFDLPLRLGMSPPGGVVVAMSQDGRRSTWTGVFQTSAGLPCRTVVRMRHLADGSADTDGGLMTFRLRTAPAEAQGGVGA